MKLLTAGTIARVYLVIALVLSTMFGSVFQLAIAIVLLGIELYLFYKPLRAGVNLALVVVSLVTAPLAFEALVDGYAFLLIIPGMFLLDDGLRNYALTQPLSFSRIGRGASDVLKALSVGLFLVFGVAVFAWNFTIIFTAILLLGYLGVMVLYVFRSIPKSSLLEDKSWSRVIVGDSENAKFNLKSKAKTAMLVSLCTVDDWVEVAPAGIQFITKNHAEVSLRFSPPLAGPSKIRVQAAYIDSRGLVQTGQVLEPLDLHIIPRAKYAKWLANKFLEQTSAGGGTAIPVPSSSSSLVKQGVEFFGSRSYQAGDRLKDIDWRHSFMLGELIVKEFSGSQGQSGVIVANLAAKDLEDADLLAYNLVMSALTLASEGLPSALAVYNQTEVLAATPLMNSRETLKKALELTEEIVVDEPKLRVLESTKLRFLKRSISQLDRAMNEEAERISQLLKLEAEATANAAKAHPATVALNRAVKNLQGQAVVTVVSNNGEDPDALAVTLEKLTDRGFGVVSVGAKKKP